MPADPPPLSTAAAVALLVAYTVVYVAPFYLSRLTRPSPTLSRDNPAVIRARIVSVSLSTAACCAATFWVLVGSGHGAPSALHAMGIVPVGVWDAVRMVVLTAMLFLGPLFETLVVERHWRVWAGRPLPGIPLAIQPAPRVAAPLVDVLSDWGSWRTIVAGPVTEELLFRSAGVPLLLLAATPVTRTVLLSPVVFGLAHVHHVYEFRLLHPRVPWLAVAARTLFQLAYTTLFGSYATFLFLRTGSLLGVCLVHAFCNSMGFPRVVGRVQRTVVDARKDDNDNGPRPASVLWTVAYYALLVAGAVFWYQNLWTLTESTSALVQF